MLLIEGIVDGIIKRIQTNLPAELVTVQAMHPVGPEDAALPMVQYFYVSERFIGLQPPAIFVLAEDSRHLVDAAQNFTFTENKIKVVILVEEVGDLAEERVTRSSWRYAMALFRALHDADLISPYPISKILVEGISYSLTITAADSNRRVFRKEAWLDLMVSSQESYT